MKLQESDGKSLKILVIGHARHGKDTVCELLRDLYGFSFVSSSEFCAKIIVYPVLASKYNYANPTDCFLDRVNHRAEWFQLISDYNSKDKARLGREIFSKFDIYCGLRNAEEMKSLKQEGLYDISIWVDASRRIKAEDSSSNTITSDMADYILDNNTTLAELKERLEVLLI